MQNFRIFIVLAGFIYFSSHHESSSKGSYEVMFQIPSYFTSTLYSSSFGCFQLNWLYDWLKIKFEGNIWQIHNPFILHWNFLNGIIQSGLEYKILIFPVKTFIIKMSIWLINQRRKCAYQHYIKIQMHLVKATSENN